MRKSFKVVVVEPIHSCGIDRVAEFTVGLILFLLRKIPLADDAVRKGEWNKKYNVLVGAELMG